MDAGGRAKPGAFAEKDTTAGMPEDEPRREQLLEMRAGLPWALTPTLGNRSRHCPTSCIHAVVSQRERERGSWRGALVRLALTPTLGNRSRRGSSSSAAVPDAALPPPSLESCIHAVVSRGEREKSDTHFLAVGSVCCD